MNAQDVCEFRIALFDFLHDHPSEAVPDLESVRDLVVAFTDRLEEEFAGDAGGD